jgi:putative ABC transport system ATP-binding protein
MVATAHVLVRASELVKAHAGQILWQGKTFAVKAGGSLAVTGPSGSGKTTLINCLGLLETPDSGDIEICGSQVISARRGARQELLRSKVGHLFQNYGLVESWTVEKNLTLAFIGRKVSRRTRRGLQAAALTRVGLEGVGRRRVHSLSGGERQRAALARLILKRPLVILADEPTAALDEDNVRVVLSVLAELREKGAAVIVATHDPTVVDWCHEQLNLGRTRDNPNLRAW